MLQTDVRKTEPRLQTSEMTASRKGLGGNFGTPVRRTPDCGDLAGSIHSGQSETVPRCGGSSPNPRRLQPGVTAILTGRAVMKARHGGKEPANGGRNHSEPRSRHFNGHLGV